jgi:glycosyltransferase involved in cell wall biosynthesis
LPSMVSASPKLLRVVTLASKSGRYGGPFDTSVRQMEVASRLGYEVRLLAGHLQGDRATDTAGNRLHTREVRRLLPFGRFGTLHSWALLRAIVVLTRRSDIVHVSLSREWIPLSAVAVARLLRKRLIIQPHGMLTARSSALHRAVDVIVRPLLGKKSTFVALTEVEAEDLRLWGKGSVRHIITMGNPLPPEVSSLMPSSSRPFATDQAVPAEALFVARLHKRKRVDLFIRAAEFAQRMGWSENYVVVGPDDGDLGLVMDAQNRLSNVKYEGTLPATQVTSRVQQCGVFVLPSEREPWGNVLATALGLHKPVVVTRSTALSAAIERFGAGSVVDDDDAASLAHAVHSVLTDREAYLTAHLGAQALSLELLSPESQSTRLSNLYASVG